MMDWDPDTTEGDYREAWQREGKRWKSNPADTVLNILDSKSCDMPRWKAFEKALREFIKELEERGL